MSFDYIIGGKCKKCGRDLKDLDFCYECGRLMNEITIESEEEYTVALWNSTTADVYISQKPLDLC